MLPDIPSNRTDRFRSGEISDQRYDQVAFLHALDGLELIFGGEETPVPGCTVRLCHQVGVAGIWGEIDETAGESKTQIGSGLKKRLRDMTNSSFILVGELETFLVLQILHHTPGTRLEEFKIGTIRLTLAQQCVRCGICR